MERKKKLEPTTSRKHIGLITYWFLQGSAILMHQFASWSCVSHLKSSNISYIKPIDITRSVGYIDTGHQQRKRTSMKNYLEKKNQYPLIK